MPDTIPECPRCRIELKETKKGEALIDICEKCDGSFFDMGELFTALGKSADPGYWDRPGVAGPVREGKISCPRCHKPMLLQDISKESTNVEIDRCSKCGGIWLDSGEADKVMSIGARMGAQVIAEQRAAREELDRMGDVDFSPPGLIFQFLSLFKS